ncbi:serine hydrolase domain-containing protein [Saccharothrix sp. BKS2]|uniref:serine hydrolase domain-containing protein n=1 Tax=Saccharothrix sp. BKS2 TaxID=3064400 RepID=UPI0039EC58D6
MAVFAPLPAAHAEPTTFDADRADAYLAEALRDTGLPGLSAVVTRGDRVVHAAGYGHDSEGNPVTADTPMRVASLSKSFTALAVMTLVEDGRIALDEPVAEQLPGFTMADPRYGRVTVRHLLNQTSGFSDTTVDVDALAGSSSLAAYVTGLAGQSLAADPGTRYRYCNANYEVAARLVEVASGRGFAEYLRSEVFGPLGMDRSGVSSAEVRPVDGHLSLFGVWLPRAELPGFHASGGGGGVVTTASDLGRWLASQTGHGVPLVSADGLRALHTPSSVAGYAMGWGPDEELGVLAHSGNLFTYTAAQAIDPDTGYGFAVLTNSAALYDDTYAVVEGLVAISRGREPGGVGGERQVIELVLGLIALAAIALGVLGVRRAGAWARCRAGAPTWRAALRCLPALLPALVLAAFPDLLSALMGGRAVTWAQLTYFPLPLTVTAAVAAVAGALVVVVRAGRLRSSRGAVPAA